MQHYRIYPLDNGGGIRPPINVHCRDDIDALAQGERLCANAPVEIWQADRLVGRMVPNDPLLGLSPYTGISA